MRESNPNVHVMEVAKESDITEHPSSINPIHMRVLVPAGRVWRKPGESLEITAKGSKNLPGGRDKDPSQNSAMERDAMKNIGAEVVNIPPSAKKCNLESMQLEIIISETSKLPNLLLFLPEADVLLRFFFAGRVLEYLSRCFFTFDQR
eukprot:gene6750-biopygen5527